MNRPPRVAIIGGGIGGLTAALSMVQRGLQVSIFESAPELREIGAGIEVTPNAMRVMRALGLEDAVRAVGWHAEVKIWRHWKSGRLVTKLEQKDVEQRYGLASCSVHRADLLDVLSSALGSEVGVTLNAACVSIESVGEVARARFKDGTEVEADLIVGADGLRSAVRASLFGPDAPRFTSKVCYRTVIPVGSLDYGESVRDGGNSRGPHGLFVTYGIRRGELINVVIFQDDLGAGLESWNSTCSASEVQDRIRDWHPTYQRVFESDSTWYKWPLYDRDPIKHWSKGSVTLLGDAAHPMLPYLGQGAAQAIEDGYILASALAYKADDLPGALSLYERVRVPRTSRVVTAARARGQANHAVSPLAQWRRDTMIGLRRRFSSDPVGFGDSWVPDYDATSPDVISSAQ